MGTLGLAARQVGLGQVALGVGLGLATYVGAWDRSPARQAWDRLPIVLNWAWPTVFKGFAHCPLGGLQTSLHLSELGTGCQ